MATKSVARSAIGFALICRQYNKKLNTRQYLQDRKKNKLPRQMIDIERSKMSHELQFCYS